MNDKMRDELNDLANKCGISSSDAFKIYHDCLRVENQSGYTDLSEEDKENNAMYFAGQKMIANAVRES